MSFGDNGSQPQKTRRTKKSGCFLGGLGIIGLPILLISLIYLALVAVGALLIVADPIEPVDAVVVLSGGAGDRLALAVEMHEKGLAPNLVITDTERSSNALLRSEAIDGGFKRETVYITDLPVESTYDEALAVGDFALGKGWESLMIVTDPYHSFRTRFIFRRELGDSGITIFVRPVVGHWFTSSTWFFRQEGWQFVFLEIAKFFNYMFMTS